MKTKIYVICVRAIRTFFQAFIAALLVTSTTGMNTAVNKQALFAAVAAGVAAVMNLWTTS